MVEVTSPPMHQTNTFLRTISLFLALITKGASRLTRRMHKAAMIDDDWKIELRTAKSPFASPKKFLKNISSKVKSPLKRKIRREDDSAAESWGHGGVWQKEILMGEKCEPLDMPGVIYYDGTGKQTSGFPYKSPPRVSPLPRYYTPHH
ncbi:hypothetical protein TanjilG_18520 [Lupinus angustifolius]|uniref:Uncharacterized protein n=1 Tax=Lupinus angustifolius TaxID=3871 RepID=A0A4P1RWR1_LUPAN|nr:PREDICTED: uncharacterized protein LOC109342108 [Lupinus angustifolius]OIW19710.1 hypothetical protein TanjilG_18520 [Lupinus angustifolius]